MRVELISQRMTAPTVFVCYQLNVINESPPLVAAVAESHSWSLCQKPPKRRQTSKAPNPMRKEPPSKANSFGVCTIGMRAEPVSNTPKKSKGNLKPQHVRWLRFTAIETPIYASSWNIRNNLWLLVSHSIQLNALTKEKSISRSSGAACDWAIVCQGSPNGHLCSVVIVVSVTAPLLVMAGIPSRRAESDAGSKIFQDPPDGGCRKQPSLRSSDHRRHHQTPCPIKI